MLKNIKITKKGISPLIATVLVIGFTIVLAAILITWGTNLFRQTQQATAKTSEINLACTEVLGSLDMKVTVAPNNNQPLLNQGLTLIALTIDNAAKHNINGFSIRIFNVGGVDADVIDTKNNITYTNGTTNFEQIAKAIGGSSQGARDFNINRNALETFVLFYNNSLISKPINIQFKPNVVIEGVAYPCPGSGAIIPF